MAEENQAQEKTEEPTPRKREKAREEGQAPRSRELATMAVLIAGSLSLLVFGPGLAESVMDVTVALFRWPTTAMNDTQMLTALGYAANEVLLAGLPLLSVVLVAGVAASGALGGFLFSSKAMAFKSSRMSPIKGFKRMFSLKSLMELAKAVAKILLVAGIAVLLLHLLTPELLGLARESVPGAIAHGVVIVIASLLLLSASLIVVAAIDVPFQLAEFKKELRMTRQEVTDEMKDTEGKPEVKSRVRQLQHEIAGRRMLADVPEADIVITNPEHFSVAIEYRPETMAAPRVLAKGADLMALRIREIALANDVPMLRAPVLTRAVYFSTEVGEEVPAGLYVAVAQVLAYVYQLETFRRGQGPAPKDPGEIDVPEEFTGDV